MYTKHRTRLALASTFGVILALATTTALASAMSVDDDEGEAGLKAQACAAIGCPDGNRECAKASGTIKAGLPPWSGEVSVSYTCYEPAAK